MHKYFPKRYKVSALAFLGFVVMFYLRTNLSIAVVAMTDGRNRTMENETYFEVSLFLKYQNACTKKNIELYSIKPVYGKTHWHQYFGGSGEKKE